MADLPIRRLTAAERARRDEEAGAHYDALFAEVEAEEREEYEREFGPEYRARHPFEPDGARIHEKIMGSLWPNQP